LAVAVSALTPLESQFANFIATYDKKYDGPLELFARFEIFRSNVRLMVEHNAANFSFAVGVNQFADMTSDEFRSHRFGFNRRLTLPAQQLIKFPDAADDVVDWRSKGSVSPVKDQGQCGACWAFSATGSLESAFHASTGRLVGFSEQQLVDCAGSQGNLGCEGGLMDSAFDFIIKNGGLCTEDAYPYVAKDTQCHGCTVVPGSHIAGYVALPEGDENSLVSAVALTPVSVAIEASGFAFQFYKSGVFNGACGTNLDHGVLAVGYDRTPSGNYWIVKNSWGSGWGEAGYIRVALGKNKCGIALVASYPHF